MKYNIEIEIKIDTQEEIGTSSLESGTLARQNSVCYTDQDSLEYELGSMFCRCIRGIQDHIPGGGVKLYELLNTIKTHAEEGFK